MKLWWMVLNLIALMLASGVTHALETSVNSYTYDATTGHVKTIDGPRTDVSDITTFDYNLTTGNLINITDALGHTTLITDHDASGQPTRIVDANQGITTLTYHPRGWLTSRTFNGQTTLFDYDNVGQLIKLTRANGAFTQYTYDAAHRLTDITDNLGNTLHYTLDAMGNVLKEEVKDDSGQLARVIQQEFDQLSRLLLSIGGENQTQRFQYDANGNLTAQTDARQTPTDRNAAKTLDPLAQDNTVTSTYDALNRLIASIHHQQSGDASDDLSNQYDYNALDQLVKVTDANGAETHYTYNALGDLLTLNSPDTGITTYTYDAAGNRTRQTDAKGTTVNYTYDALNRLTSILYPDSSLNIHYTYDENYTGQNGIGRLTTLTDASGTTAYGYDKRGNLTIVTVIRGSVTYTTQYAYNGADQLTQATYPSGRTVDYGYDSAGRINGASTIDTQGASQNLLTNVEYEPFGPINGMVYGNGLPSQYSFDLDYRPTDLNTSPALDRSYDYDKTNNITAIIDNLIIGQDQSYAYDGLSRLIDAQSINDTRLYQYDSNGNRTQLTDNGTIDHYQYPLESNRLQNINNTQLYSYDANGNTTHLPNPAISTALIYGDHNRLSEVNGVKYTYNGNGQRVIKDNGTQTHYHYGLSGQLIAETDAQGNTLKEYLYLENQLIALVEPSTGNSGTTEIILDNPDASFSDNWPISTSVSGYQGSHYQFHAGSSTVGPGVVGDPIDNHQANFTGTWPNSTSVNTYYGNNYQFHAGSTATLGVLGNPVDNQQATFTGTWPNSTSVKQYYAGNYQYHAAGTGANTARWSVGVSSTGSYDVYVNWTAHANRASNAKFTIHHSNGSDTVTVNQQQNGGLWHLLGTYPLDSNSTISLSDDANGYVIADAISILPAGSPPTVTQNDETASWALNVTTPGRYDVYANWASHANRATDAKYTVHHANGSDTKTVNQQRKGGQWNVLGTFDLDANSNIELSSIANGYVVADAVSILPEGTTPETTTQGETATWTPNQTGEFQIYANWTAHANRATDAKYTINHASGSDTLSVNQKQNGGQWQLLGTFTLNTSSQITLSSAANGYVIADGIRLVKTTPTSATPGIYFVHPDHLGTPQVITDENQAIVWQANYDSFGKATIITENITNNIRFPGQYFDQETELHYNYFRYYDPSTGRYITSDPIGLNGGLNTYAYVGGNPLRWVDPKGLETVFIYNSAGETHTGLYVDNPSDSPHIYDPGGSYAYPQETDYGTTTLIPPGSGDLFSDEQADLQKYINYQMQDNGTVYLLRFDTTAKEEAKLVESMRQDGGRSGGFCATGVSNVLGTIDRFKNLSQPFFIRKPETLYEYLQNFKPSKIQQRTKNPK